MKHLALLRKICQISVLTLFCALPFLATLDFTLIKGSLFSLDFFNLPFADPASAMQTLAQGALQDSFPLDTLLIGAFFSLLVAFFLGRIFCGWICPYGLFSELFAKRKKAWKHSKILKTVIFFIALSLAAIFGYPLITYLSMPGQLTLAPIVGRQDTYLALLLLLFPLLALIMDLCFRRRFFCTSICPQSLLLGASASRLPKALPGMRIKWKKEKCSCKGAPCEKACQFALQPRKNPNRFDCTMCGDCIAACAKNGAALSFSFKKVNQK